jgi:hypothetical protein
MLQHLLVGDFDNFQQVWQQNTDTPAHVVMTDHPHRLLHSVVRLSETEANALVATHYTNRDVTQVISTELYVFDGLSMRIFELNNSESSTDYTSVSASETVIWKQNGDLWHGQGTSRRYVLTANGLEAIDTQTNGLFYNTGKENFRLLRCRFFMGWIEIPHPNDVTQIYRFPNLRLHDQGDKVQLQMPDGSLGKYTIELTQLVFGHTIFIMKLAVYELNSTDVSYNSHSVAYTWTNPDAQRIGINLRYILTGWTLENTGLGVSKNP